MANELSVTISAVLSNGEHKESFQPGTDTIDQAAIGAHAPVVIVGFSAEEDLAVGDISTLGWIFLKNLDSTNYVTWGPKDTTMKAVGRLEAGESAALRLEPGITIRWQANTANVKVKVLLLED